VESEQRNVKTVRCRMMTNKIVKRSNAPQETATDCGCVICRLLRRRSDC